MRSLRDHALEYMERGWSVIPVVPGSKVPAVDWKKYQKERATEARIILWWDQNPNYNVGIITGQVSGLLVVDIDPGHGGKADGFPETTTISATGGGGQHLFYQIPDEGYGSYTGPEGIDIRCEGGFVVAPPSIHKTGNAYVWDPDEDLGTIDIKTLERLAPRQNGKTTTDQLKLKGKDKSKTGKITEGGRNEAIASKAGYYAAQGVKVDKTIALMQQHNQDRFEPPLSKKEVEKTVRSIYRTDDRNNPERHAELDHLEDDEEDDDKDFELITYEDLVLEHGGQSVEWLIPGYVPDKTVGFIVGPPGSFKTWIEFDMAVSLASGLPFLGDEKAKPERPGTVIIIQQEDALGPIADRLSTIYMAKLGITAPHIEDGVLHVEFPKGKLAIKLYKDRKFRFDNVKCVRNLAKAIKKHRPVAVFFDPLYSLVPLDDHMEKAVDYLQCLKLLRDMFGTSFFLVHHTTKSSLGGNSRQSIHGSQFLNAYLESLIQMHNVTGCKTGAVMDRRSKATGPTDPVRIDFDIFDGSSEEPGEWRYNTKLTEISESKMFKLISPDARPDDDDEDTPQPTPEEYIGMDPRQVQVMELASRSSGLTKYEITKDDIDPKVVAGLISKRKLIVDGPTGVIYKYKT